MLLRRTNGVLIPLYSNLRLLLRNCKALIVVMKKTITYLLFISLVSFAGFALGADPIKKSEEMCKCMEEGMKNKKKLKSCLSLQERHNKKLKVGSDDHILYKDKVSACENKLAGANAGSTEGTYEDKVKEVCDCFQKSASNPGDKPICFRKQSQLGKTLDESKRQEFNNATNSCG